MNPPEYLQIEEIIARASKDLKGDCYFVGGYVRDNLLGRVSKDIDLVVVGDTPDKLLLLIAKKFNWSPPTYAKRFGTAQVNGKIGKKTFFVEAVTARKESYSRDSRKPNVVPASLEEDLLRRDFTINTLCKDMEGNLLDLTKKGLTDLKAGAHRNFQR
jgi:tRNA nucleotidyltransferase/poly(A) polymerase